MTRKTVGRWLRKLANRWDSATPSKQTMFVMTPTTTSATGTVTYYEVK